MLQREYKEKEAREMSMPTLIHDQSRSQTSSSDNGAPAGAYLSLGANQHSETVFCYLKRILTSSYSHVYELCRENNLGASTACLFDCMVRRYIALIFGDVLQIRLDSLGKEASYQKYA